MKTIRLELAYTLICLLFAVSRLNGADAEPTEPAHPLEGSWRWNFTMPDGTTSRPKLVLEVTKGKLTGVISFRSSTSARITNAVIDGDHLRFQVVRQRDGHPIVTTYSGKWSTNDIKGTVESDWAGEKQSYAWEAKRAHIGVEGRWQWQVSFGGGRPFTMRVDLEQDGEILTGSMPGFGRRAQKTDIKNGSFKDGEVYFEVEFGTNEDKTVTIYQGKQFGDTIEGTRKRMNADGELDREDEWYAKRAD